MANHKSAIKRLRQSLKKRDHNRSRRSEVRTALKKAQAAAKDGHVDEAKELARAAESLMASATKKGLFHPSNFSRRISRLQGLVNKTAAAK